MDDAIIVGAGFGGLYALHRLRQLGLRARVFERGDGVGGTWYWNRYPGARCDVESLDYSYSFSPELEQEWEWTERYPTQPEILRYLNHVADRFDLRRDIELETTVTAAAFDELGGRWIVTTEDAREHAARFLILAVGCLSTRLEPPFPGLERFDGAWYHTADWPPEGVDFGGQRVGVVGTGSTGIQVIPQIAAQAEHLYVFQRTPSFSVPARNAPLDPDQQRAEKRRYPERRALAKRSPSGVPVELNHRSALDVSDEERLAEYERRWARGGGASMLVSYSDLLRSQAANDTIAEFVRLKIRETVNDPEVAERLCPRDYPLGAKRICVDTGYYETYNRDNVTLVDVRSAPIEQVTRAGLRLADRQEYAVDKLVFAIGFDAITGTLLNIDIRGRGGQSLRDTWAGGPRSYLGLAVAGFPNLLTVTGPGSPSVHSNVVHSIEQHVDWIADCLDWLRRRGLTCLEATAEAESAWFEHVDAVGRETLYPRANSWYMGANVPGKPRRVMTYVGGVPAYREACDRVAAAGYEGFRATRSAQTEPVTRASASRL
jgi:cyclohexanone monooxygenase